MQGLKNTGPLFIIAWRCTRACNYNCAYCSFASTPEPSADELDTKGGMHVVDEISDFGATWFGISGGEPLLRKDIFEIISHARDIGLKVSLITNGYFVKGETFDNLAKNEVHTSISLDGSEPVNDKLRGKGAYKRALSAIKKLSDNNILDCLVLTLTNINYKEVDHVVCLAEEYGARWVVIHGMIPVGKAKKNIHLSPTPEQYEWTWNHLYDLTSEYKGKVDINVYCPSYARVVEQRGVPNFQDWYDNYFLGKCTMNGKYVGIIENGDVKPCGFNERLKLGNIMEKSLKEFWSDLQSSEFHAKFNRRSNLKGKCSVCEYGNICGGCRTRSEVYTGDIFQSDPTCAYIPKTLHKA